MRAQSVKANLPTGRWLPVLLGYGLLMVLAGSAGCGRSADERTAANEIRLALNWIPDAQHAGYFAADVFGEFARQQLQVRIIPGGPAAPVVQSVALGQVEFAVAGADQILMARAQGAPVVCVLASMQDSPRCIMLHRAAGIRSLHELNDVTLALGAGKSFAVFLQQQIPLRNVKVVPYTGSVALFLQDERFAQQAYVFSEPYQVRSQGADPVTLMVSDLGFNPYEGCLITHEQLIRSDPDRVRRVVEAIRRGWLAYFRNPGPVHARILSVNSQIDAGSLEFGIEALKPLCLPPDKPESVIGAMEPNRWQTLCDQLIEIGFLEAGTDPSQAYTNEFIQPLTMPVETVRPNVTSESS